MEVLFQRSIRWPERSITTVETSDGHTVILHLPILKSRWDLFASNPQEALARARSLTEEQLRAILLFIYSELPAKHSMRDVFELCQLRQPENLQDSRFVMDMRELLADTESADFCLLSHDDQQTFCHRTILAARSKYFRALLVTESEEADSGRWKCTRKLEHRTLQALVEYIYTGQIQEPDTLDLIPLVWLAKYLRLSAEKEIDNIIASSLNQRLADAKRDEEDGESVDRIYEAAKEWNVEYVTLIIDKYRNVKRR